MNILSQLKSNSFRFQKRWGQNFLTDGNLLSAIVSDAKITENDFVVEIGAGAGTLTRAIAQKANKVLAFEIDKSLSPVLDEVQKDNPNVEIFYGDVLKQPVEEILQDKPFRLVANLPYYITTPVIFQFLPLPNLLSITVMVQKEVAERFSALEGTANYGAVTAQLRAYGNVKMTRVVSRNLFTPPPNVDSAVVHLEIDKRKDVKNFDTLQKVIAASFAMRRKTLLNNLCAAFSFSKEEGTSLLQKANLSLSIRGETLSIDQFVILANLIH
ncbi:MAG: 16S rRNA (adenine(1518)-N(6)/adenine(1519)-N(6))-dimethyltransferase RsmA [Firmicutes bacterium]|nr:16S rRNA (adenine(1518)-N(6)/adenine(1519)-N(6))-dimethyltransferase RsmA [Bacillota bacterium]